MTKKHITSKIYSGTDSNFNVQCSSMNLYIQYCTTGCVVSKHKHNVAIQINRRTPSLVHTPSLDQYAFNLLTPNQNLSGLLLSDCPAIALCFN